MYIDIGYTGLFGWRQLALNLIRSLNLDESLKHSFKEYHSPQASYVNLLRTPALTVKLYKLKGEEDSPLLVNVHTHSYASHTIWLSGCVESVVYKVTGPKYPKPGYTSYVWDKESKRPSEGAEFCEIFPFRRDVLTGHGSSYYLTPNEPHSIRAVMDSWILVLQYKNVQKARIFLPSYILSDIEGVYTPYKPEELESDLEEATAILSKD